MRPNLTARSNAPAALGVLLLILRQCLSFHDRRAPVGKAIKCRIAARVMHAQHYR